MAGRSPKRPPSRRRTARPADRREEPDLLTTLSALLREPHPLAFLEWASTLTSMVAPEQAEVPEDERVDPAAFAALFEIEHPAVDALQVVLSALAPDQVVARSPRGPRPAMPGWIEHLDETAATRVVSMEDVFRDADDIAIEVRMADGAVFTMVVLIDHNLGTIVKDAFALDAPLEAVLERWQQVAEPGTSVTELRPADAGARIREALEDLQDFADLPETETWPASRPLLEWVVRLLPADGQGWRVERWSERRLSGLAHDILETNPIPLGPDAEDVLLALLAFAADSGLGDPLRWSPVSVEVLFAAWLPSRVVADRQWYEQVPETLRALVRYAHARRRVPRARSQEVFEAIDHWSASVVDLPSRMDEAALLAALAHGSDALVDGRFELALLTEEAGGADVLDSLDTTPLPDEPLLLADVPEDIAPAVRGIGRLVTDGIDRYFGDIELRTAALRLLAGAAAADPAVFRRRSNPAMTAAAVTWVVGKANDAFGPRRTVKGMMEQFGLTGSASQRAAALLHAIGRRWDGPLSRDLGDPALLTSARRAGMIEARDRLRGLSEE